MKDLSAQWPKSGRIKIKGYFGSDDGMVEGLGEKGSSFVETYEKICADNKRKTEEWVKKLQELGIKAAHPNDGWHKQDEGYFGLSYPYFKEEIKIGSMVALGDYDKFVVVIVQKISGILCKNYHYTCK